MCYDFGSEAIAQDKEFASYADRPAPKPFTRSQRPRNQAKYFSQESAPCANSWVDDPFDGLLEALLVLSKESYKDDSNTYCECGLTMNFLNEP